MSDFLLDPETGSISKGEMIEGVRYRSVPSRFLPDSFASELVFEPVGGAPVIAGVTNARARIRLREAGIHPYPKDVEQYRKQRMMTEDDKKRHSAKLAKVVRSSRDLDGRSERAVEGE